MELDYDNIFRISIRAMKINKSHPSVKRDKKWIAFFLFFHGLFSLVFLLIMYNIIFHNIKNKDFDETCKNGVLSVVFFVVTFQLCILLWKQHLIMSLMTHVKKDYADAKYLTNDYREIIIDYSKKGVYVCKQWLVVSFSAFAIFPLKNIVLMTYHWSIGDPKLIPLYDLIYPGIMGENKDNLRVYLAAYAMLTYYGFYAVATYTAFVPLGPSFMLHACGQLEIVERQILDLFRDEDNVEQKLKEIVKKLQSIYGFVDDIKLTFRVAYELTLKATTIILPITFYEVIESVNKKELPLEFITFIIGGTLISSSPCYYSDLLMEKGENVRMAMYSCGWESVYNPGVRSTIRIVMLRALRPVAIRTLFRTVCLDALTDLFQQSYTIFNLMNAMWE